MKVLFSPDASGHRDILRPGEIDGDRFDRARRIPWLDLDRLSKAKVMLVGAGALGNEVAKDLALSGIGKITIVDMDHVVGSNLNRCLFFSDGDVSEKAKKAEVVANGIARLNGTSEAIPVVSRIEEVRDSVLGEQDVILGCLDNIQARLHVNSHAYALGKTYIDGGMEGLIGKVMVVVPPKGACLQCGMNRTHAKVAALRFSCTGKDVVFHEPRLAAEITTTSLISAVMVREALKSLSGHPEMMLSNAFYYDGERNMSEELEVTIDPSCPVHPEV